MNSIAIGMLNDYSFGTAALICLGFWLILASGCKLKSEVKESVHNPVGSECVDSILTLGSLTVKKTNLGDSLLRDMNYTIALASWRSVGNGLKSSMGNEMAKQYCFFQGLLRSELFLFLGNPDRISDTQSEYYLENIYDKSGEYNGCFMIFHGSSQYIYYAFHSCH